MDPLLHRATYQQQNKWKANRISALVTKLICNRPVVSTLSFSGKRVFHKISSINSYHSINHNSSAVFFHQNQSPDGRWFPIFYFLNIWSSLLLITYFSLCYSLIQTWKTTFYWKLTFFYVKIKAWEYNNYHYQNVETGLMNGGRASNSFITQPASNAVKDLENEMGIGFIRTQITSRWSSSMPARWWIDPCPSAIKILWAFELFSTLHSITPSWLEPSFHYWRKATWWDLFFLRETRIWRSSMTSRISEAKLCIFLNSYNRDPL